MLRAESSPYFMKRDSIFIRRNMPAIHDSKLEEVK